MPLISLMPKIQTQNDKKKKKKKQPKFTFKCP